MTTSNNKYDLSELKKSIDRLALIELCKAGATNQQIRDIFGSLDNNYITKIRKAVKNSGVE